MSSCRSHFVSSQIHKCILDQSMNYEAAGIAAANSLIKTAELQEMIDQSNLFMFDNKGRLSTQMNKTLLNALNDVQDELPSIANLDLFVQTIDTRLMMVVSKNKPKILHKQWVRSNAKWAKAMLATLKRSALKASTRTSKPKKQGGGFGQTAHEEETGNHRIGGQSEGNGQAGHGTNDIDCISLVPRCSCWQRGGAIGCISPGPDSKSCQQWRGIVCIRHGPFQLHQSRSQRSGFRRGDGFRLQVQGGSGDRSRGRG